MVMGRGEPCCMLLRKSYVTPPVETVAAWCSLGAGEGGAGERKWAIIFPFSLNCGENVFKIYQKAVINKQIPKSRDLSPTGRADWAHDQTVGAG